MSRMNAGIILGAQQANPVSALAQGQALRAQTDQMANQNALRNLYQTQGANIMAGDSNALNALAQFDPQQALAIQSRHQQMDQSRASHDQVMAQRAQAMKIQVEKYAQTLTKEQREAEAAQLEQGITRAIGLYQAGNLDGVNQILQSVGEQPLESLDQFPAIAALYGDALSTLKSVAELTAQEEPDYVTIDGKLVQKNAEGGPAVVNIDGFDDGPKGADFKTTQDLRKEFNGLPAVKAFSEQSQAFGRIVASAKDPSPAGDLAMIFNFMKVLDPGSVVRESEFATAAQASAWLQQSEEAGMTVPRPIAGAIRQLATGQRLSPEQRQDFVNRGEALYNEAERGFEFIRSQYEGIAQRNNISVEDGLIDFRFQDEQPTEAGGSGSQPSFEFQNDQQRLLFEKYAVPSGQ